MDDDDDIFDLARLVSSFLRVGMSHALAFFKLWFQANQEVSCV